MRHGSQRSDLGQPHRGDDYVRHLVGWGAILAPTVHTLTDLSEWIAGGFSAVALWLNYVAFLPLPALFIGLYCLQRPRIQIFGLGGAIAYGFAFVYFAHTTLFALATQTQNYQQLWAHMGWLYTFHGGLMIAGGVAFGIATACAGVLPRWTAWVFLSGLGLNFTLSLLPVPELLQTVGSAVRNVGIVGMGLAVLRSVRRPPG